MIKYSKEKKSAVCQECNDTRVTYKNSVVDACLVCTAAAEADYCGKGEAGSEVSEVVRQVS